MAINDYDPKRRRITGKAKFREYSKIQSDCILAEAREHSAPKKGVRETVLETYRTYQAEGKNGEVAAYIVLQEYNKRTNSTFTKEDLKQWIAEDLLKRGKKKDDGFDR